MKTGADLNQPSDITTSHYLTFVRLHHTRNELQQSGLARTVKPQQGYTFTLLDIDSHAVERVKFLRQVAFTAFHQPHEGFLHGPSVPQHEAFDEVIHPNNHWCVRVNRGQLHLLNLHALIRAPGRSYPQTYGRGNRQSERSEETHQ